MREQPQPQSTPDSSSGPKTRLNPDPAQSEIPLPAPTSGIDLGPLRNLDSSPTPQPPRIPTSGDPGSNPDHSPEPAASSTSRAVNIPKGLPAVGDRLDVFEIQEAIGVGGMGAVFRAADTRLDRLVALKVLPPEVAGDSENIRRFYQEARAAARLDHENIARVYSIGQDRGVHFIAFEHIEGTNIRQRVERLGPLSVAETINFTLQIAGALVHASERSVVHRDIKPSNLIVTPQGRAKLVDMGLARRFERTGTDDGLTQSGMTLGTFDYISPEQARDPRDVDVRSDLYSLGCTMFHMLTGHPPFPGGTVLQKLLSHREEPAPDVRTLNPEVPPQLASIILRLMAKDPSRRFQTPDLLMRELLSLAGELGLRSISPEGLVWTNPQAPPAWERHLFWGLPAGLLVLIVGTLLLWGQADNNRDAELGALGLDLPATSTPSDSPATPQLTPRGMASNPEPNQAASEHTKITSAPESDSDLSGSTPPPRTIQASTGDELLHALNGAATDATVILTSPGPYVLETSVTLRHNLVLRAAPGIRPILRLATSSGTGADSPPPLFRIEGGSVSLEGMTFEPGDGPTGPAILANRARLTLEACAFLGNRQPAALEIVNPVPNDSLPTRPAEPIYLEACLFQGARVAILGRGTLDLGLRDCSFASASPVVWFDNAEAQAPVPARLWLSHVSVLASADPLLRFDRTEARVQVQESLFAPSLDSVPTTLVAIDDPDRLDWSGRDNLYARVGTFLLPTRDAKGQRPTWDFESWSESGGTPRELGSRLVQEHAWTLPDPNQSLTRGEDPALAFRPNLSITRAAPVGSRRCPSGPISPPLTSLLAKTDNQQPRVDSSPPSNTQSNPRIASPSGSTRAGSSNDPMTMPEESIPLEPMIMPPGDSELANRPPSQPSTLPTAPSPPSSSSESGITSPAVPPSGLDSPAELASNEPRTQPPPPPSPNPDQARPGPGSDLIHNSTQFMERLRLLGPQGGVLELDADADLVLPSCLVQGGGLLEIVARGGDSRPRLHFRPQPSDGADPDWPALFKVRAGGLKLQGVDLILSESDAPPSGRWAAFNLAPGTGLELERSTVTIQGVKRSALIRLPSPDADAGATSPVSTTSVRLLHSFLRSGDDIVEVAAGRNLDLALTNVSVLATGSLIHGHALPVGRDEARLKIDLRQATALLAGGLVHLESTGGEPVLPVAELVARDAIVGTAAPGNALIRVDGQEEVEELADRVRWEGHNVAYHRVEFYRRDQSSLPGTLPLILDRGQWELFIGSKEVSPFHGDVRFEHDPAPMKSPWKLGRQDLRLDPESPVAYSSPDLTRIPQPPPLTDPSPAVSPDDIDLLNQFPGFPR